MVDVISGGRPERQQSRWRRVLIGAGVLVLLAAGIARLTQGSHPQVRATPAPGLPSVAPTRSAARVATPSPATTPVPVVVPTSSVVRPAPVLPEVIPLLDGVSATVPADLELVIGGQHPAVVGAATSLLGQLPVRPDQAMTGAVPIAGGILAQVEWLQFSTTGPMSRIYYVRSDGRYTLLALADKAVPSLDRQHVFALSLARGAARSGTLTEVTLTGQQVARHAVPVGFTVWSDSAAGLLVSGYPSHGKGAADLRLVDPATLATRHDLGNVNLVEAATSTQVAWIPAGCGSSCNLTVTDLAHADADAQSVPDPAGFTPGTVSFSPDGHSVAISYLGDSAEPAPGFLDVINLTTGVRTRIPGVATALGQTADLAWTPDGRSLAFSVAVSGDVRRIGLWPAHGGSVQLLPGEFADTEDSASTLLAL